MLNLFQYLFFAPFARAKGAQKHAPNSRPLASLTIFLNLEFVKTHITSNVQRLACFFPNLRKYLGES
jgi:hypothetical protein